MENTNITLRTTTITLDEYNRLRDQIDSYRDTVAAKDAAIASLNEKLHAEKEKEPLVKVVHYNKENSYEYDEWSGDERETSYLSQRSVEFVNLADVKNMALAEAKAGLKEKISELESKINRNEYTIKQLRENVDVVQDKLEAKEKQIRKLKLQQTEELEDKSETYTKNVEELKKAYAEDTKQYKETIKELKEEIQKVKDSKTDAEIEEKRNKEIKDLKGRIKDLEGLLEELGKLNFFKRVFKLRTISAERLEAQKELLKRERAANSVGTTWVKENGKIRKYDAFSSMIDRMFKVAFIDPFDWMITKTGSTNARRGW